MPGRDEEKTESDRQIKVGTEASSRGDDTSEFSLSDSLPPYEAAYSDDLLRVCGWCEKVFVDGVWLEHNAACTELQRVGKRLSPHRTHGICPACFEEVKNVRQPARSQTRFCINVKNGP